MAKMVVQQPQPIMTTTASYSNQWGTGICECGQNIAECCFAFWCFPCFACSTSRKFGECLCLPVLDGFGLIPPITLSMRSTMRQRYGIEGSMCNDCVYSFFCLPCVWCQMSREMKLRGNNITFINSRAR